jgi:hypothetical protein
MESKRKRKKPWKLLEDNNYDEEKQKIKHLPFKKKIKTLPLKSTLLKNERHLPSPLTKARILLDHLKKDGKKSYSNTELLADLGMAANSTWRNMIAKLKTEGFIKVEKETNMIELCSADAIIPLDLNKHAPFKKIIKTPSPAPSNPINQFKKTKTKTPVGKIKTQTPGGGRPTNQFKKAKTPVGKIKTKTSVGDRHDPRVVEYLKSWFINHFNFPYPTGIEKQRMIADTGINMKRLDQWFNNKRRDIRKVGTKDKRRHWKAGKVDSKKLYSRVDPDDDCDGTISHSSSRTEVRIKVNAEECESEQTFIKVTKTLLVDHNNNYNKEDIFCNQSTKRRAIKLNTGNQYSDDGGSSYINNNAATTHTQDTIPIKMEESPFSHILADPETWLRKTENLFEELPPIEHNCSSNSSIACIGNINNDDTIVIQPNDVIFGRGGHRNPGNVQYRSLVKACLKLFSLAGRGDKYKIAQFIVISVRKIGGRFLQRIKKSTINPPTTEVVKEEDPHIWIDIGNIPARDKTCHALWAQGKKLASIGIGDGNKINSDGNKSNININSKFVYRAVEGPQPIYGYALDLISLVCNNGDDITGGSGSVVQKRDGVILHSYHKHQPHRVLDKPLFGYKPETEPEKERLMRLQVNDSFRCYYLLFVCHLSTNRTCCNISLSPHNNSLYLIYIYIYIYLWNNIHCVSSFGSNNVYGM